MPLSPADPVGNGCAGPGLAPVSAFAIPAFKGCTNLTLWLKVTPWTCPINPPALGNACPGPDPQDPNPSWGYLGGPVTCEGLGPLPPPTSLDKTLHC